MKLTKNIFLTIVCICFYYAGNAQNYTIKSPDKSITMEVFVGEQLLYNLFVDGNQVLKNSVLDLQVSHKNLGYNAKVKNVSRRTVNQILHPIVRVKSETILDHFNEFTITFNGNYKINFRAYNNGVAYRFETNYKNEIIVISETAKFNFSANYKSFFPRESEFHSHNERLYEEHYLDSLTSNDLCSLPTLITTEKASKIFITESSLLDYPGMWLRGADGFGLNAVFPRVSIEEKVDANRWLDDRSTRVTKTADYIAKTKGTRTFPWRIVGISKTDADLIKNQLTYQLAEPSRIKDTSWIKPGKVAWDWWNFNNIYGVDFKAGVNTETYKYYIDFASKNNLQYIIMDEGWYELGDVLKEVPDIDVQEIINYGIKKNVGVILWVTWSSLDQQLDEALKIYESWGVKGLKIDFMQRDDQWMVQYYERIAKACAEHKLLVNFHGSYKPSGLHRTYPNVLTREGVKGNENNKWADYMTPKHNLTLPFIRMVAGPMDYTPGSMRNAQEENFTISWNRPMSLGTRCHQLAMYVCFESPLQMLCDSPSNYYKEPEVMQFLSEVPAVWDETIVLNAKVSEKLVLARKSENKWFLGGMAVEAQEITLDFSFLEKSQKYKMVIYSDGVNVDRVAIDYKRTIVAIDSTYKEKIKIAKGGGFVAILSPIK
jgi:alpha-glucosidase